MDEVKQREENNCARARPRPESAARARSGRGREARSARGGRGAGARARAARRGPRRPARAGRRAASGRGGHARDTDQRHDHGGGARPRRRRWRRRRPQVHPRRSIRDSAAYRAGDSAPRRDEPDAGRVARALSPPALTPPRRRPADVRAGRARAPRSRPSSSSAPPWPISASQEPGQAVLELTELDRALPRSRAGVVRAALDRRGLLSAARLSPVAGRAQAGARRLSQEPAGGRRAAQDRALPPGAGRPGGRPARPGSRWCVTTRAAPPPARRAPSSAAGKAPLAAAARRRAGPAFLTRPRPPVYLSAFSTHCATVRQDMYLLEDMAVMRLQGWREDARGWRLGAPGAYQADRLPR